MAMPNVQRRRLLAAMSALSLSSCATSLRTAGASPGGAKPNIVFILADDLGFADLGVYGQTAFATPRLDGLARQGVRFTQAYANSAVCSASRFGLITGRYQYRLRGGLEEPITGVSDTIGLPPGHPTLPSLLRSAGYDTALFGKWHLGYLPTFGPLKSGYDVFFGNYGGAIDYFTHKPAADPREPGDLFEGETPVEEIGYYTDMLASRAVDYLRARSDSRPFFLSLHFTAPHWPWEGPGDEATSRQLTSLFHFDGGSLAIYARMVVAMDAAIGRVLDALDERGLAANTIVVFTSDNGGERFSNTWPLSGQKSELLEGGIRVPAIVRWPSRIGAGATSTQVAIGMDWLPTLLAAAGAASDPSYPPDGESLLPGMLGAKAPHPRTLFWRYKANAQRAVRSGDWKYFKISGNEFLFDLAADPRERANVAKKNPAIFSDLRSRWEAWDATMLPITKEVGTYWIKGKSQADHYRSQQPD